MYARLDKDDYDKIDDVTRNSEVLLREEFLNNQLHDDTYAEELDVRVQLQAGAITEAKAEERIKAIEKRRGLYQKLAYDAGMQRLSMANDLADKMHSKGMKKGSIIGAVGGIVGGIAGTIAFALVKDTLKEALGKLLK